MAIVSLSASYFSGAVAGVRLPYLRLYWIGVPIYSHCAPSCSSRPSQKDELMWSVSLAFVTLEPSALDVLDSPMDFLKVIGLDVMTRVSVYSYLRQSS